MALGRPVVVTPEVGIASLVRECGAGLVAEGDPERLAGAVATLLANPDAAERMGLVGRETVQERFTWDAVARRMEEVYGEIVARETSLRGRHGRPL